MVEESFSSGTEFLDIIFFAVGLLLFMSLAIVLFFYFSRKKIIKAQLEKANLEIEYQKELLQSTILTQEEERKRIAQDLHDVISSKLNVVSLNANMLFGNDLESSEVHRIGESIRKTTTTVLENSRRIAHDLLPPTLEKFGFQAALEELCEEIESTAQFKVEYSIEYPERFLKSSDELHLFRIAQELFNNSIKHSQATEIEIILEPHKNDLSLNYRDNGKGFDVDRAMKSKGLGMSGILNRAEFIGADCKVESEPGRGITVTLKCKPTYED